jgi:hypothetical protein
MKRLPNKEMQELTSGGFGRALRARTSLMRRLPLISVFDGRAARRE